MNEITKFLEEKLDDYEAARRNADRYLKEKADDLSGGMTYAKYLELPLKENQMFFFFGKDQPGKELSLLYEQFKKSVGKNNTFISCGKKLGSGVTKVQKNTREFWEALARSKYLFVAGTLPFPFVKRDGQVYFNAFEQAQTTSLSGTSVMTSILSREFLKTDFTLCPDEDSARELWEKKTGFLRLYQGTVLLSKDPKKQISDIAKAILGEDMASFTKGLTCLPGASAGNKKLSPMASDFTGSQGASAGNKKFSSAPSDFLNSQNASSGRKKLLVLTSWKASREQKYVIRGILGQLDSSQYDVTVLSSYAEEPLFQEDFAALGDSFTKIMYRGRIPLTAEDLRTCRILEKNPELYVENPEIREFMDARMNREWSRIWGAPQSFDACLILGAQGYQPYYLAMAGNFKKRILIDLDFLENLQEKAPAKWQKALTAFDEIYYLSAQENPGAYGPENKDSVRRLPLSVVTENLPKPVSPLPQAPIGETVDYAGAQYLLCDCWQEKDAYQITLLAQPEKAAAGSQEKGDSAKDSSGSAENPLPALCDVLFSSKI